MAPTLLQMFQPVRWRAAKLWLLLLKFRDLFMHLISIIFRIH